MATMTDILGIGILYYVRSDLNTGVPTMRLPLKCVDLKSLITILSVYTLLWIAKSSSLSYLDWVKMGKSCNGATNPVRANFHFVSWLGI